MDWTLKSERPIFKQLMEQIQMQIIAGIYLPGDKLPSVRELAANAAVNPNTMQRALSELEQSGLIYSQRTSGRFITEDKTMIEQARDSIAKEYTKEFLDNMKNIGYGKNDVINMIEQADEEEQDEHSSGM